MNRRSVVLAAVAAITAVALGPADLRAGEPVPPTLVELFTSQGCSSCPPADAFVEELNKRDDVVALSLHVNYWDYIGWKDPFASAAMTDRQRLYGRQFSRGTIYTPQMVIDGVIDAVGSNKRAVKRAIEKARAADRPRINIELTRAEDGGLVVLVPGAHFDGTAAIWLARYDAEHVTDIARGENGGRTLRNFNVVRDLSRVGTWAGQPIEIRLPESALTSGEGGRDGCAIIVQVEGTGPVLGVRKLMLADDTS